MSFFCQAEGDPPPYIEWRRNGKKVKSQRYMIIEMKGEHDSRSLFLLSRCYLALSVFILVYPSVCLSLVVPVSRCISKHVEPDVRCDVSLLVYFHSHYPSICPSIHPSIRQSVRPSIRLFVHPSVCSGETIH